jgi:hypothetical protein
MVELKTAINSPAAASFRETISETFMERGLDMPYQPQTLVPPGV